MDRSNLKQSSKPAVLLIAYHFYPSTEVGARRPTALAQYLASKGIRVVVVSAFGEREIESESEIFPGVIAIPVKRPARKFIDALVSLKQSRQMFDDKDTAAADHNITPAVERGLAATMAGAVREAFFRVAFFVDEYKKWGWRALKSGLAAGKKHSVRLVVASSPPHSVLLAGAGVARGLGIPHIADLRDPWAEAVAYSYPSRRLEVKLLRALEGWVMRSSAAITSTGATVAESLARQHRGVQHKIHVIRNGYDGEYRHLPQSTGGRLAILFAGELYLGRNPFPLLIALEAVLARPEIDANRISVTFMGSGPLYQGESISDWLWGKRCAAIVKVLPRLPAEAVTQAVAESTVLLNLAQEQPLSVPAKTYEHLVSGRENLLICENDCETARLIAGIDGVNQVDPRDAHGLEQVLLDLYRRHAIEGWLKAPAAKDVLKFSRCAAHERFWSVMVSVAALDEPPPCR
jgi:glycosyl transferase family 4